MVKLKGEDTAEALKEWAKKELVESSSRIYDLGKFLFSVSLGTAGLFVALEKLSETPAFDWEIILSLISFFLSIVAALLMALPRKWDITGSTDLMVKQREKAASAREFLLMWFVFWLLGTVFGAITIKP